MNLVVRFGIYFIIVLGALIIYHAISGFWEGAGSEKWPSVQGEIIKSQVTTRSTYSGSSWRHEKFSDILYGYQVNGVSFTNYRITFDGSYPDIGDSLASEFPLGKKITVFYDPADPENSVLFPIRRSVEEIIGTALMGICFAILGIYGAWQFERNN